MGADDHYLMRSLPQGVLLLNLVTENTETLCALQIAPKYKMIRKLCLELLFYPIAAFC